MDAKEFMDGIKSELAKYEPIKPIDQAMQKTVDQLSGFEKDLFYFAEQHRVMMFQSINLSNQLLGSVIFRSNRIMYAFLTSGLDFLKRRG
jgi:hypothetical protein